MNIFEITIQHRSENGFPVVVEQTLPGQLPLRREGYLNFVQKDAALLADDLRRLQLDPRAYGELLGKALFHETIRDLFMQARSASQGSLRVLLVVEDPELRSLHWERLCGPIRLDGKYDFLARDQQILFSLYLPSLTDRRFPAIGRQDFRALVLIADPPEPNDYSLAPFDAALTASGIRTSLGDIPHDILANIEDAVGPPTLDALCSRITGSHYTLLHITAHGWFNPETGETILYLLDKDGSVAPVPAGQFLERLDRLQGKRGLPHMAFLSTCDSCNPEAESAGALGGLAQRLVRDLGMPAVIAMTQKVSMVTADRLSASFYKRLRDHGEVDRALVQACIAIADAADLTVPALFSRLGGRPLFSDTQDRPLTHTEIEHGLSLLEGLMPERAPVMTDRFEKHAGVVMRYSQTDESAVSGEAKKERQDALDAVNAISEEVLDLNFRAVALDQPIPAYDARCPFPGLYAFQRKDREFFFGRETLVKLLIERLENQRFLAVLGPSGSGKSSVVLAGLVPEIQKRFPDIRVSYMTPGNDPAGRLEKAISNDSHAPDHNRVLVADQFEELFTLCAGEDKRREFINHLLSLHRNGFKIILTMRADFWGDCAVYPQLKTIMQDHQELIAPMNTAELRSAMEQQAAVVGLRFEADLSHTILSEVRNEPGAMPLLQHLLQELWKRRHGRWLRADEYRALGGIRQGIAHTADEIYRRFSEPEKEQMRNIFIRLTRLGDRGETSQESRDTRRRVAMKDLIPAGEQAQSIRNIINRLADARLVITRPVEDDTEVEVTHEALIRHWPRLRKWLDEDRHSLQILADISEDARTWHAGNREDNLLPRWNTRLEEAVILFRQPRFVQNQLEQDYLTACIELRDREAAQQAAYTARLKKRLVAAVVGIIIAAVAGGFAFFQRQEALVQKQAAVAQEQVAVRQRQIADQQKQEAQKQTLRAEEQLVRAQRNMGYVFNEKAERSMEAGNFNGARMYLYHALKNFEPKTAEPGRSKTFGMILNQQDYPMIFLTPDASQHDGPINCVAFSPDGNTLASGSYDKTIRLWDVRTGHEKHVLSGHREAVFCIAFSPDGKLLASGSEDMTIRVWDIHTGKEKLKLVGHLDAVNSVSFSPDGKTMVSGSGELDSRDYTVRLWDVKTGKEKAILSGHTEYVKNVSFSRDGNIIVSASRDQTIRFWDAGTGLEKSRLSEKRIYVESIRFSPDGKTLAAGYNDNTIRLWRVDTVSGSATLEKTMDSEQMTVSVIHMSFSPDGKTLSAVTDGYQPTIYLWDVTKGEKKTEISLGVTINCVVFSPDGKTLVSGTDDPTIRFLDVETGHEKYPRVGHTQEIRNVSFSPDGKTMVSGSSDHTIRIWDMETGKQKIMIPTEIKSDMGVCFSPDGKTMVSGSEDALIQMWDVETGQKKLSLSGHLGLVTSLTLSPDGKTLVSGSQDQTIRLWDMETGKEKNQLLGHRGYVLSVDFSPDGKTLASGSLDNQIRLWDVETGKVKLTLSGHEQPVTCVSFSPDGRSLASGSWEHTIRLWDAETGKQTLAVSGLGAECQSLAFSQDGKTLASGLSDHTIQLYDTVTGKLKVVLYGHNHRVIRVQFSPDGKTLVSGSYDNTVRLWDVETKDTRLYGHSDRVSDIRFSPDGKTLASASEDKTIRLWDTKTGKEKAQLIGNAYTVDCVDFSPDGKTLVSFDSTDGNIRLWDVATGREKMTISAGSAYTRKINFSPDGKIIASGTSENTIRLWDAETGKEKGLLSGHEGRVTALSFSPDGKILVSGSDDATIRLWDPETGKEQSRVHGYVNSAWILKFSPDGETLAMGFYDHNIYLWDVQKAEETAALKGHTNTVLGVCFSPDGKILASGSDDNTIRLWDVETGTEKALLAGHTEGVMSVKFSPDGKTLASGSKDKTIRMWDLSLFYNVGDHRLSDEKLRYAEKIYHLRSMNLELQPAPNEKNLYAVEPERPRWSTSNPFYWLSKAREKDPEAMLQLGIIYHRDDQYPQAIEWYKKAAEHGNKDAEERLKWLPKQQAISIYRQVISLWDKKAYRQVIDTCSRVVELDSEHVDAFFMRGRSYQMTGQLKAAESDLRKVTLLNPESAEAFGMLGESMILQGKFAEAAKPASRAHELEPEKGQWIMNLGHACLLGNDPVTAKKYYQMYIDLERYNKDDIISELAGFDIFIEKGWKPEQCRETKQWVWGSWKQKTVAYFADALDKPIYSGDQIIEYCNTIIDLDPEFEEAYFYRGKSYCEKKRLNDAQSDLQKAIDLNPEFADAFLWYGKTLIAQGRFTEAEKMIQKTIELNPESAPAMFQLANIYFLRGNMDKAERYYSKALAGQVSEFWVWVDDDFDLFIEKGFKPDESRKMKEILDPVDAVKIRDIVKGSQGEKAGLSAGDIVLSYNGVDISYSGNLYHEVDKNSDKPAVEIIVLRDNKRLRYTLKGGKIGVYLQNTKMLKFD